MKKIITKDFNGNKIHTFIWNDKPCWIANEIVSIFNYADSSTTIRQCIEAEEFESNIEYEILEKENLREFKKIAKSLTKVKLVSQNTKHLIILCEDGLYGFLQYTDRPIGVKFRKWIRRVVLAEINDTGGYIENDDLFINIYLPYADENTKLMFKNTLSIVRKQNETILIQKSKINKQCKEIQHKRDVISGFTDKVTLAGKRQILNKVVRYKGANFKKMWDVLYDQFQMMYKINLDKQLEKYNKCYNPKLKNKLDYVDKVMHKVPEIYEIACKLYENDVKELVQEIYELNKNNIFETCSESFLKEF